MAWGNWFIYPVTTDAVGPPPQEPVSQDKWHQGWSEPTREKSRVTARLYPFAAQEPSIALDWFLPLSQPVRVKIGPPASTQFSTYTPVPLETVTPDKWFAPLSEPVRLRAISAAQRQGALFAPPSVENITIDKWHQPLGLPIRQKARAWEQVSAFAPNPVVSFAWFGPLPDPPKAKRPPTPDHFFAPPIITAEIVTPDKWFQQLSDPPKAKYSLGEKFRGENEWTAVAVSLKWFSPLAMPVRVKPPSISDYFFAPSTVGENVTVDKWFSPLAEPAKPKTSIHAASQQAFTSIVSPIIPSFGYYRPLQTPPARKAYLAAEQQVTAFAPQPIVPSFGWYVRLSEPHRRITSQASQQALALPATTPVVTTSWFAPLSEPVRVRHIGVALRPTAPIFVTEVVTVDKWFRPLATPVRRRPSQYQFDFVAPRQPDVAKDLAAAWIAPLDQPIFRKRLNISDYTFAPPRGIEIITLDKWFQQFSHPVWKQVRPRVTPLPATGIAAAAAPSMDWVPPWSEPVRVRIFQTAQQQDLAYGSWSPILPSFGYYRPLQTPPVRKAYLAAQQQVAAFAPQPITPSFGWFGALSDPVKQKIGLSAASQQALAFVPFTEIVTPDKWFEALGEPVRVRAFQASQQQTSAFAPSPITPSLGWYVRLSEPHRRVASQASQQALAIPATPPVTTSWFVSLAEPVRRKPYLAAQQREFFYGYSPIIPSFGYYRQLSQPRFTRPLRSADYAVAPVSVPSVFTNWFNPLAEPQRQKRGLLAAQQRDFFYGTYSPIIPSFGYYHQLNQPLFAKQLRLADYIFSPVFAREFILPDKWFQALSDPPKAKRSPDEKYRGENDWTAITVSLKWFSPLAEPVRIRPQLPVSSQPFMAALTAVPIIPSFGYFGPLSQFPGFRPSLLAAHQQFFTYGTPPIIFTHLASLAAIEQGDFLQAVLYTFNIPITCYVDIIERNPFVAGFGGVVEKGPQQGILASIVEPVPIGSSGVAVPQVAGARVAIITS